jgi:hypothetical protein
MTCEQPQQQPNLLQQQRQQEEAGTALPVGAVSIFWSDACTCAAPVNEQQAFAGEPEKLSCLLLQQQQS